VLDNTFASPVNQQPLALGVDLAMQSATKYLNGHSDVTAGVVSGRAALLQPIEATRRLLGPVLDPRAAAALGRGLKTLSVRIERQNASAQAIAEFLARDVRVSAVCYPGLPTHPDHEIARRQMSGFGGVVAFDLGGSLERAEACYDRLGLIQRAASLGGVESIVSLPVLTSHQGWSDDELRAAGISRGMVRVSVGLEDVDDLVADLDRALG
jgi:cystathionine beta-lyase/cystathionine gamma-synthase